MLSPQSNDSIILNLTCPLCLGLFTEPRSIPACSHTFCLTCLQLLKRELVGSNFAIKCPQCRAVSMLSGDYKQVEDFPVNFVAKNIVDAVQSSGSEQQLKMSANMDLTNSCLHLTQAVKGADCRHCSQRFCEPCRVLHMEQLKTASLKMAKTVLDDALPLFGDKNMTIKQIEEKTEKEVEAVRAKILALGQQTKAIFAAGIDKLVGQLCDRLGQLKPAPLDSIRPLVEAIGDEYALNLLRKQRDFINSTSVLNQDLDDLAGFYIEMKKLNNSLKDLEKLADYSKRQLVEFHVSPGLAVTIPALFESTAFLGDLKVSASDIDVGLSSSPILASPLQKHPHPSSPASKSNSGDLILSPNKRSRKGVAIIGGQASIIPEELLNIGTGDDAEEGKSYEVAQKPPTALHPAPWIAELVPSGTFKIAPAQKILAIPSKGSFALLRQNEITFMSHRTGVTSDRAVKLEKGIVVDQLATDDRDLYFSGLKLDVWSGNRQRVIGHFSLAPRGRIEVFISWRTEKLLSYHSLAVSRQWQNHVVTTEDRSVIILRKVADGVWQENSKTMFRHEFGLNPQILGIREISPVSICVIASSADRQDQVFTILLAKDAYGTINMAAIQSFKTFLPGPFALWNNCCDVLVPKELWLQKFTHFPENPFFAGNFALKLLPGLDLKNEDIVDLAVVRSKTDSADQTTSDILALLYSNMTSTFMVFTQIA